MVRIIEGACVLLGMPICVQNNLVGVRNVSHMVPCVQSVSRRIKNFRGVSVRSNIRKQTGLLKSEI